MITIAIFFFISDCTFELYSVIRVDLSLDVARDGDGRDSHRENCENCPFHIFVF